MTATKMDDRPGGLRLRCSSLLAAAALVLAPHAAPGDVRLIDAVVASVDGVPITLVELEKFEKGRGLLTPGSNEFDRAEFLEVMIEERLFAAEFEAQGIVVDDEDTQAYIDRILAANKSNREAVEVALAGIGLEWNDYYERMRFEVQKLALINREVRTRANVTDEDVERHWKKSPQYALRPRVEVSHIYIPLPDDGNLLETEGAKKTAQDAHEMIRKAGFKKAAAKHSAGPTADEGGKLGVFEIGSMAPHFEEQVTVLEEGEYSDPFVADGAIHIVRVDAIYSEGRVDLEEVEEEIRAQLYDELLAARFQRWINEDLRELYHVTMQLDDLPELVASTPAPPAPDAAAPAPPPDAPAAPAAEETGGSAAAPS